MSVSLGKPAPDFKLFNTEKKEISLTDYRGKNLVILFFPLAFTGTCTIELCTIRDNYNDYTKLNAEVIGISIDSLFVLEKYKKDQNFNFELLSDFNKTASKAYGVLYDEFVFGMKGVSKRSAFVVDKQGAIQYAEILEKASDQPNYENIKACLTELH
ncbi:MAG: alkyl hydroperoxide reductase/Thiol specific antioxidant/Mal allergen [Bacteroidota bacterium]|jgi:peroxiredoxin|nr:alkyl hydroperoxide reductase/Thiol specific antioxidant/Mal allergen [Bacteroidota bacterium]